MAESSPHDEDGGFWNERRAAAALKHGILRRYLPVFVTKTGAYSRDGQVLYFDGYAGRGRYDDGSPGSPLIAVDIGRQVAAQRRPKELQLFLVEKSRAERNRLIRLLTAEAPDFAPVIREGDAGDHVAEVITYASGMPLFAFLDPYGLGFPMASVVKLMKRPRDARGRPQTELLINFSDPMVRRIGGLLTTSKPQDRDVTTLARMDAVCGGRWWRSEYRQAVSTTAGVATVVAGYRQRLRGAASCGDWCVPVRNKEQHEPRYYLIFLSRHLDGLWEFGEALSNATAEWRRAAQAAALNGQPPLFDWEALVEEGWVTTIARNISSLIDTGKAPFAIYQRYADVMGDTLGLARSMHIRAAVRRLYAEGRTATDGKGDVRSLVVRAPAGP